jgi:hypothetical protein
LEAWAERDLPQFITASHIDIADIERISRFRSPVGHDYSDSFETCCSMKHYYRPLNYYEVRFTQPIYSPVDGVILYLDKEIVLEAEAWLVDYEQVTGMSPPSDYEDLRMYIRPDEAPNVWILHHHVLPLEEIRNKIPVSSGVDKMLGIARPTMPGYRVSAGDLIAHGLGEISVEEHLDGNGVPSPCNAAIHRATWGDLPGCTSKRRFHSIFEFMTDEVFAEYRAVADVTRDDFIITAEDRSTNPLECDGEDFVNRDLDAYVRLQGTPWPEEAGLTNEPSLSEGLFPTTEALANGRSVWAAFDGSGSPELESFDATSTYVLAVVSDGGPIDVFVNDGNGLRGIYSRLASSGINTYETSLLDPGTIRVSVEASEEIGWRIVAVASP